MSADGHDELLERWAEWEVASAPELHPTPEMIQLVRRRKGATRRRVAWWLGAAAVAASMLALWTLEPRRQAFEVSVGVRLGLHEPKKGGPKGLPRGRSVNPFCAQLAFVHYRVGSANLRTLDLLPPRELPPLALGPQADFCLHLQVAREAGETFLYVFQLDSRGALTRLFPREDRPAPRNPLRSGYRQRVPPAPHWFHLMGEVGRRRLYLAFSATRRTEWNALYEEYSRARDSGEQRRIAAILSQELEARARKSSPGVFVQVLDIRRQANSPLFAANSGEFALAPNVITAVRQ